MPWDAPWALGLGSWVLGLGSRFTGSWGPKVKATGLFPKDPRSKTQDPVTTTRIYTEAASPPARPERGLEPLDPPASRSALTPARWRGSVQVAGSDLSMRGYRSWVLGLGDRISARRCESS